MDGQGCTTSAAVNGHQPRPPPSATPGINQKNAPPAARQPISRNSNGSSMPPRNVDVDVAASLPPTVEPVVTEETHEQKRPPMQIVWTNVVYYLILHLSALYGLIQLFFAHPLTWLWTFFLYLVGSLGITAGAHRLWAHRSYKATLPARILLTIFNCVAFQNDIIEWARDHRVHHKYSETDADPHNAKRGFFFAHIGWLLVRKHPDVKVKGKDLNYDDLYKDPVLIVQRKVYLPSVIILCFAIPTLLPWYYWGESALRAFLICGVFRYVLSLNVTWFVNSAAHMWGNKPYDRQINPAENFFVTFGAVGEGFHNYHHTFPNDYSTSEYGWKLNLTTLFIDTLAALGWVYDRKKMGYDTVFRRRQRTGDGSSGFGHLDWKSKSQKEKSSPQKEHSS